MLFEGSPSTSVNRNAFVELKFTSAAISQPTLTNEYSPFTDSVAPFIILIASASNLTV